MRVADYIFRTLADHNVRDVFVVTGGGAMHLDDALGREPRLRYICNHHEQASAMAAEAHARITNKVGVACVTSGPGGINAINGVFGAWTDSIPVLVLSGQMKRETLLRTHNLTGRLRQLGDQEADVVAMVSGITKYAHVVTEPESIRYHLERALHLATHGRPGPCWLDIPIDVQAALINPEALLSYDPAGDSAVVATAQTCDSTVLRDHARDVARRLLEARRPVLLGGTGVRLAGAVPQFRQLAERLNIPVTTAWTHDLIPGDHPLFCGRQGTIGTRAGNFTVQNADLLLIVGSRLCIRQISYNWQSFARAAHTIQVDIDAAELSKPTFRAAQPIHADARAFLDLLLEELSAVHTPLPAHIEWLAWCRERVRRFPNVLPRHRQSSPGSINQYHFIELLFAAARADAIFACGDATACITPFQAGDLKDGQRLFSNSGSASMGYDLPSAIGAAVAAPDRQTICLAGDGSIMMNLQELATIVHNRLPIKIFVLCNGGYQSIRATQQNFFNRLVGEGPDSGVGFPDFVALARAYSIPAARLDTATSASAAAHITTVLAADGPQLIAVDLDPTQTFEPKLSSRRLPDGRMVTSPLEDMAPFLDREELKENMLIPVLDD
ncbi:acetolactate synthase [Opitutaceae bacterium TAV5]|nr:acetolactate synthase [Opitutaceae bacterium TAV5]